MNHNVNKKSQLYKISDVVSYEKGKKPSELLQVRENDNDLPYLITDFLRGKNYPQLCKQNEKNIVKVSDSDTIMIWDGSNSGQSFTGFSGVLASTMIKITSNKKQLLHPSYLFYYLNRMFRYLNYLTIGTGVPHISKDIFLNLKINVPPINEQIKIINILSNVDYIIDKSQEQINSTTILKKGLLQQLLTKGIGHTEFKETSLGRIPKEWEIRYLKQVCYRRNDIFNPKKSKIDLPYIGLEHIIPETPEIEKYGSSKEVLSIKSIFQCGDILFGKLRPYLKKVSFPMFEGVCSTDILVLRSNNKYIESKFLYYILSSKRIINFAIKTSIGTKMPRTSWKYLSEILVQIPTLSEQRRIIIILESVNELLKLYYKQEAYYTVIKKGLMQQLLTGKIRVKV